MSRRALLRVSGRLLIFAAAAVLFPGCAQRPFIIADRRVCQTVDGTGKPAASSDQFTTHDKVVYVWFRYDRAKLAQAVKVKFKYTDPTGMEATEVIRTELKPGSGSATVQLKPLDDAGLVAGKYQAEITSDSDAAYGPALIFEVQGAAGPPGLPSVPGAPAPSGAPSAAPGGEVPGAGQPASPSPAPAMPSPSGTPSPGPGGAAPGVVQPASPPSPAPTTRASSGAPPAGPGAAVRGAGRPTGPHPAPVAPASSRAPSAGPGG